MKSIMTLVVVALMASPSFAAPAKKVVKSDTVNSASDNSTSYSSNHSGKKAIDWQASLGLGTAGNAFHFGTMAEGLYNVTTFELGTLYVGGRTGFLYGPSTPSSWIIPVMAETQLNFKGTSKFVPFAGIAMGVGVFHVNVDIPAIAIPGVPEVSATNVDFAMFVKGGVFFGDEGNYYAELPLGTMGNSFTILPSFGMKF